MKQVEIDIPLGVPIMKQKKQVEINRELQDHINFVEQKFKELNGREKNIEESRKINLINYKIDKNIFGFCADNFELRDKINFFDKNVFSNSIVQPLVKLNQNQIDKNELEQNQILKKIKQIACIFGKQPKNLEIIILLIILINISVDAYQLTTILSPQISFQTNYLMLPLRIFFLFILFICQFIYVYNASKLYFLITYILCALTTIIDILCLYGFDLMNEQIILLIGQLIQGSIIIIGCFLLCIYFYKLEMNLQKIRVLLGAQYQPPFWCIQS